VERSGVGFNASGSCTVNINCSVGIPYTEEKKAVGLITYLDNISGLSVIGSGFLVNATGSSTFRKPYFMTAEHVTGSEPTGYYFDYIFYFNYDNSGCSNDFTSPFLKSSSFQGAFLRTVGDRVHEVRSDYTLLELYDRPEDWADVSYLGWDKRPIVPTGGTVNISHPWGDAKKIAIDNHSPDMVNELSYSCLTQEYWLEAWKVVWDAGVTQPISSGSPLLNSSKRVIGLLHGGLSRCADSPSDQAVCGLAASDGPDWFVRMDYMWNHQNPGQSELFSYLDPANTGADYIDGYYPPAPPTSLNCNNGIKDGLETGIDCGGVCGPCLPFCENGIQDNGEMGLDCGGTCKPCGFTLPFIAANFNISDTYVSTGDGPVVFTDTSISNIDLNTATFYWDFGEGAFPRYAYTRGPHSVCYNNIVNYKSIYLAITHSPSYTDGNKRQNVYVADNNLGQCNASSPQWVTNPGANVLAAQSNGNLTDLVGINNGNLASISCDLTGASVTYGKCAFTSGDVCLYDPYFGTHGDPSIVGNQGKGNSLRFWSGGFVAEHATSHIKTPYISSEGFYYQHPTNFIAGKAYRLSFYAKAHLLPGYTSPVDHLNISLADGLQPSDYCAGPADNGSAYRLPTYPFSLYRLGSFNNIVDGAWRNLIVSFIPPTGNFNQIWIYPFVEESQLPNVIIPGGTSNLRNTAVFLDDFSLRAYDSDCATDVIVNNATSNSVYEAAYTVSSSGIYSINTGQSKIFKAGEAITLNPGFSAMSGSTFTATIAECTTAPGGRISYSEILQADEHIYLRNHFDNEEKKDLSMYPIEIMPAIGEESYLKLIPNPAKEKIKAIADLNVESEVEISLVNIVGLTLDKRRITSVRNINEVFDITNLANGLYLIIIKTPVWMEVKQFIKD
jgi:hypothetical protein